MRKIIKTVSLIFVLTSFITLVSCDKPNVTSSSTKEIIELNLNNYTDYIAITKQSNYTDWSSTTYWNFSGSSNFNYKNVVIYYKYSSSDEEKTCELTAFGSGQITGYWQSGIHSGTATITGVTGTVELNRTINLKNEIVLNFENYDKYITLSIVNNSGNMYGTIYWNFTGSINYYYENVTISYRFNDSIENCKLTVFGTGQIIGAEFSGSHHWSAEIINVSGTVKMPV